MSWSYDSVNRPLESKPLPDIIAEWKERYERLRKAAEALHDKLVERCGPYPKWKPEMDALRAALEEGK